MTATTTRRQQRGDNNEVTATARPHGNGDNDGDGDEASHWHNCYYGYPSNLPAPVKPASNPYPHVRVRVEAGIELEKAGAFLSSANQDFDQEDEETSINKSSDDSPNDNDSSDKTDADRSSGGSSHGGDPSEDEGTMESLPLNMSCAAEEVCPDEAGPSCSPQLRGKEMQVGHKPHVAKEEELKRTIKVTEKVRNMDTGRGAAIIHPDIWRMNR
ncbi:hypothetical protein EDB84DRAFT_1446358 [Lactarius hengduanensis]|nr:hypothetical protein EDB84DRAFT_1446358 [Lactarius hengduanensis]